MTRRFVTRVPTRFLVAITVALALILPAAAGVAATTDTGAGIAVARSGVATTVPVGGSASSYAVGSAPHAIAIGDFNGDGQDDLAVANGASVTVSILLGQADGSFGGAVDYLSGDPGTAGTFQAGYLAGGDFDSDGRVDLAIGTGWILRGNGDGTFTRGTDHGVVGSGPLLSGDFNGDGTADLAVTIFRFVGLGRFNGVAVLLGNGDGTFAVPIEQPLVCCSEGGGYITSADVDRDGDLDIVHSQSIRGPFLSLLRGNGDGTFVTSALNADGGSYGVASADFDLDGKLDLAVGAGYANSVSIQLGDGTGAYGPLTFYPIGHFPDGIATGDFDGDGRPDVAAGAADSVAILFGLGDGTLVPPELRAVGSAPSYVTTNDFNHDGLDDLAVANTGAGTITVLLSGPFDALTSTSALRDDVIAMGLPKSVRMQLTAQLDRALSALTGGDTTSACSALGTFLRDIGKQSVKKLSAEEARSLTAEARWIRGHLGCP